MDALLPDPAVGEEWVEKAACLMWDCPRAQAGLSREADFILEPGGEVK